ncbi:hypothetical protein ACJQWL_13355, partial [Lysobacter sp. A3-1-A15]
AAPAPAMEGTRQAAPPPRERRHSYTTGARAAPAAMAQSRALRQQGTREEPAAQFHAGMDSAASLSTPAPPSEWFAGIRRLRDRGDLDAARDMLARFLDAHPGRDVPDDLQPLLPVTYPAP